MIESGLYEWATANPNLQALMGHADARRQSPFKAFYFSFYPKGGALPGIVLDRLQSRNEAETLDPGSRAPGQIIEARFQFGSVASLAGEGSSAIPEGAAGYLAAAALSQALRRELMELASGRAELPDGTVINDVTIEDEYDAHYEVGGVGYLLRRVLQVTILYEEGS